MLLERFDDKGLSQFSYAVGCPATGVAAVVDPRRDVDVYLRFEQESGLAIRWVLETHIHADFASGARELAHRTGAELMLSAHDAGERYETAFPHTALAGGEVVEIGRLRLQALHTPGHTPEHLAFLIYDTPRSREVPAAMLSGDFLFVGSLGRPDLLGEDEKRRLAALLYRSVRNALTDLPDGLEVHPGHGAGSMCGAGMSGRPLSTLGFERVANPYLARDLDEARFVETILASVPPFPPYYRRMKEINAAGPRLLGGIPGTTALDVAAAARHVDAGHLVVDVRDQVSFGRGHLPGALGIGLDGQLSTWAGWVVPYDRPLLLVAPSAEAAEVAARALVRVGLDGIEGYLDGGFEAWQQAGLPVEETPQLGAAEACRRLAGGALRLLDVRTPAEWRSGHPAGAQHLPAHLVAERIAELDGDAPLAVLCRSGYRSTVAASVLQRLGRREVMNVTGGVAAWQRAGLPLVQEG